jgi:outer membrane translocation and assembly module TamA
MALFFDAGTVAPRFKDLSADDLRYDYGIGVRFHGPAVTALRLDLARSDEGWKLVIAASAPF